MSIQHNLSQRTMRRHRQNNVNNILNSIRSVSPRLHVIPETSNSVDSSDASEIDSVGEFETFSTPVPNIGSDIHTIFNKIDNSTTTDESSFQVELRKWSLSNNITHSAMNSLLEIMNKFMPNIKLPKDARTFLNTPRTVHVMELSGGSFVYFNLFQTIKNRVKLGFVRGSGLTSNVKATIGNVDPLHVLTMTIGVDGIPVCKSNNKQFWPILGSIDQCLVQIPFVIGLYYGETKPQDHQFLAQFIIDFKQLENEGIEIGRVKYIFRLSKILADAPARSFLKGIKNHNSYNGCERCQQKGSWLGRIVYSDTVSILRTDESFRLHVDSSHHQNVSVFQELKFGLVKQFPLDYLHLVCLGVTRKILRQWIKGRRPHKIKYADVDCISKRLVSFKKYFPKDFQRKPRPLQEVDHYKGTEFRTVLLYTGLAAFDKIIDKKKLKHFLLLHCAVFILLSDLCSDTYWNQQARKLLNEFVQKAGRMYGEEFITYNVHSLLHLPDDAQEFGDLESCSTFQFENFMQVIKKMIRGKTYFLQQVAKRIREKELLLYDQPRNVKPRVQISSKCGDNCFLLRNHKIIIVKNVVSVVDNEYTCTEYLRRQNVNGYPINSETLGIFHVRKSSSSFGIQLTEEDIICKMVRLPYRASFICMPLLHTLIR